MPDLELAPGMEKQLREYGALHVIAAYHGAWTACMERLESAEVVVEQARKVASASHVNTIPVGDFLDLQSTIRQLDDEQ